MIPPPPTLAAVVIMLAGACDVASAESLPAPHGRLYSLSASYTGIATTDFDGAASGRRADVRETRFAADFRIGSDERSELTLGFDYQYTRFEYEGIPGRDRDLHRVQLPLRWRYRRDAWRLDADFSAGLSTSSNVLQNVLDEVSSDDAIVTFRVEVLYPARDAGLRWLAGFAHDRTFGEPNLYPVFGATKSLTPDVVLRLAFPDSALRYASSDRHHWTARLFPAGQAWHVVSDELGAEFNYRVEALRLQGTWSYNIRSSIWLDLSAGYEFRRHHSFVDDVGQRVDADLDSEALFAIGVRIGNGAGPLVRLFRDF